MKECKQSRVPNGHKSVDFLYSDMAAMLRD